METELIIRLATDQDTEGINRLYNAVYKKNRRIDQFNWEFQSAPAGKSIYVIALDSGQVVGTQCVIPYKLITGSGEIILSGKSEDTLIAPSHRGKKIFERMYALLINTCREQGIRCIWGFTYAIKPFQKLGFDVPYRAVMGLLVLNPLPASRYFISLSENRRALENLKIRILVFSSWLKGYLKFGAIKQNQTLSDSAFVLNDQKHNYIQSPEHFGLLLDKAFLNYRIDSNPYNTNYHYLRLLAPDQSVLAAMIYTVTKQKVAYILHLELAKQADQKQISYMIRHLRSAPALKSCSVIRCWGFKHQVQNRREVEALSASGFTFINRGISLVWMKLDQGLQRDPQNMVLSRLASQGTD
ncbi:MAG TPA: GNAT family N-acetyltransferase [Bacteroidia bacterium]|nr:GNAT family N-acetyltransferase [Bacteroidia bacterium]